jgi:copper homeostasis protein (lipoprotein)
MFTSDTSYPVLTRGAGSEVEVLLRRVPGKKKTSASPPLGQFPASFEGELPCADCPGVFYHLDLFEDRVFFLRTTYLGRAVGGVFDSIGSWVFDGREGRIILFGSSESALYFRVVDADTLRKLDVEGRSIESELNYDLKRKPDSLPIEPRLMMRGMYRYMADAALFEECSSGRRFQVAQEADNVALERAYLEARAEPGDPILVSFQGRVAERPAMEGGGTVLTVVPERFIGIRPGETCGARGSTSEIKDNRWKLVRLGDEPVVTGRNQREAHIVLRSKDRRITGTGGCNSFSGSYEIEGDAIDFGALATTMMACPDGEDVDLALVAALEKAATFQKTPHHLELFDTDGQSLARFEARELQ